jgi:hypothetical protein
MKHLIALIAICIAFTGVAQAQTAMTASGTLTDATTGYVTSKVPGGYGNLSIQLIVTKTSGTVAGTAWLQASNDGTNYVTINSTDTLALTNVAAQSKLWNVGISPYLYYRAKITTTGTQVSTGTGYYLFRPAN